MILNDSLIFLFWNRKYNEQSIHLKMITKTVIQYFYPKSNKKHIVLSIFIDFK